MKIRLDQIQTEPFAWREVVQLAAASLDRVELLELSPVECEGKITRTDAGFLLTARLTYEQVVACDRCLVRISDRREERLEALLLAGSPGRSGGEQELNEEDLGVVQLGGEVLETEPLITEQVQLGLPVKPLCRPDCAGLCPGCGADLNHEPCRCEAKPVDPRWAALAALRGRGRRGEGA